MNFKNTQDIDDTTSIKYKSIYAVCILFLCFIGYKWQGNLSVYMDILAADEAEYLRNGTALFNTIHKDWGPSYNIWYKLLSYFTHSKLELYYLNYKLTAILAAVLLFVVLERFKIQLIIAFFIACLFFFSSLNIETWPRVSHFVFICILLGLYLSSFIKDNVAKLFLFAAVSIIAAYARPEIRPFSFALYALALVVWYFNKTPFAKTGTAFIAAFILLIFFQWIFGAPASFYRGNVDRMYIAFCQHVAVNEFLHHDKTVDAMAGWRVYANKVFPLCDTFSCIIKTYPLAVLKNIGYNIPNYFLTLTTVLGSFLFPVVVLKKHKIFIGVCVIMWLFIVLSLFYKPFRQALFAALKRYKWQFISVTIIGLPSMLTSILIFPRLHYLLCHIFIFIFVLSFLLSQVVRKINLPLFSIFPLMILMYFISPKANNYKYFSDNHDLGNLCGQKYVQYFNKDSNNRHVIFSDILNLSYMLPNNYADYSVEYDFKKGMKFDSIRNKFNIDIVLVNENILKNPYLKQDSTWWNFLTNYQQFGFDKKQVYNECNIYILTKNNTLK